MSQVAIRRKPTNSGYSLYLDYTIAGKRQYEFLRLYVVSPVRSQADKARNRAAEQAAAKMRAERELELINNKFQMVSASARKLPLIDFIKSHSLTRMRALMAGAAARWLADTNRAALAIGSLSREDVEDFSCWLSRNYSAITAHNYFASFRGLMSEAITSSLCPHNIFRRGAAPRRPRAKIDYLTSDEVRRVGAVLPESISRPFLFCCLTGLRISDVRKLTYEEIRDNTIRSTQKKTGEPINVPLSADASALIRERGTGVIFPDMPCDSYCNLALKKAAAEARINKRLHWHMTRHTFAVLLLSQGASIYVVSKLLGHTNLQTTIAHYATIDQQSRIAAINLFPSLF